MAAPPGNKFWLLRSTHGRNPIFKKPKDLWEAACEYFEWAQTNPISAQDNKGTKNVNEVDFVRPFTIYALCIYLDIGRSTWNDYRDNNDFSLVVHKIDDIIYNQKFEGAAVGIFNHNIIARDLGLTDKTDITSKGEKIEAITGVNIIEDGASKQSSAETD